MESIPTWWGIKDLTVCLDHKHYATILALIQMQLRCFYTYDLYITPGNSICSHSDAIFDAVTEMLDVLLCFQCQALQTAASIWQRNTESRKGTGIQRLARLQAQELAHAFCASWQMQLRHSKS